MAYLFDISQAGSTSLQAKAKEPVTKDFVITNRTPRNIHTRIYMKENSDATKSAWASIKGKTELLVDIKPGDVQTVTATITPPQGAPAGKSTFYLYAQDTDQPDEGDKSPAISVEVMQGAAPTTPGWVIPVVVVVVLLVVGLGGWLVYSHFSSTTTTTTAGKVALPSVVGMKVGDAQQNLGYQGFTSVTTAPNLAGGTATPGVVYGQTPAANTPVSLTTPISLAFVPSTVTVPTQLQGQQVGAAIATLQGVGLQFEGVCCATSVSAEQLVKTTSPALGSSTALGSKVVLYVTDPAPASSGVVPPVIKVNPANLSLLQNSAAYRQRVAVVNRNMVLQK